MHISFQMKSNDMLFLKAGNHAWGTYGFKTNAFDDLIDPIKTFYGNVIEQCLQSWSRVTIGTYGLLLRAHGEM